MNHSTLTALDSSLYPQVWAQQVFNEPTLLLIAMLTGAVSPDAKAFAQSLQDNNTYQDWINATVFGRYIQLQFAAFYQQTEDSFNVDLPELFRHELNRYGQYLPVGQILFVAGKISEQARGEKLFTTTLNPATVVLAAQQLSQLSNKSMLSNTQTIIINQIRVTGGQVLAFPLRHNKRTSERIRNEVLILDFHDLRLVDEQIINKKLEGKKSITLLDNSAILLRSYELR